MKAFNPPLKLIARYVATVLLVGLAILIREVLVREFGPLPSYITLYPAVILAAFIGGVGTGLLATILGSIVFDYIYLPPTGLFSVEKFNDALGLGIFAVSGVLISIMADRLERLRVKRKTARLAREKFGTMFQEHKAPMLLIDPKTGSIVDANEAASTFYGYSRERLCHLSIQDINQLPSDEITEEMAKASDARKNHFIFPHRLANGDIRSVEVYSSGVDLHGKSYLFSVIHDVTSRMQAEEALRESEERFHTLADATFEGIAISEQGRVIDANDQLLRIIGCTREQLIGHEIASLVVPEDRDRVMASITKGLESHIEHLMFRWDGTPIIVETHGRTLTRQGRQARITTIRDVTERRRAEEAARASDLLLHAVIETTLDPVYVKDRQSRIVMCNPALEAVTGKTTSEIIGRTDSEYYNDAITGEALRRNDLLVMESGHSLTVEETINTPLGVRIFVSSKAPHRNQAGEIIGIVGISHDITERKQAEEALRESEEKYRTVVERADDGIIIIQDGVVKYANPRMAELDGSTVDLLIGSPITDHIHATDVDRITEIYRRRMAGEEVVSSYEAVLQRRDGSPAQAELAVGMIRYHGKPAVLALIRDITERKLAEEALQSTLERFYAILSNSYSAILLVADDGRVEFANQSFCRIFGLNDPPEALRGLTDQELFGKIRHSYLHPEEAIARIKHIVAERKRVKGEEVTMSGGRMSVRDFVPISVNGRAYGRAWYHLDITERKRLEEELRASRDELELRVAERTEELVEAAEKVRSERQRFLDVLDTLPVILDIIRPDCRIEWANRAYREALGDNTGRLCYESQFSRNEPCEECQAFIPLVTGQPQHWEWTLPNGRTFDIYDFPFVGEDGSPLILEMDMDITEQRQAERERARLEEQLRQAQKMEALGTLSGGIAHDFNNILAAIIGFTELVDGHLPEGSKEKRHTKRVLEASIRGRDLVRQMLAFSRKSEEERRPLLLSGIVKEAAKLIRATIPSTIDIRTTIESESGLVLADPVHIHQVLMNLCANAAYAMREKGGVLDIELADFNVSPSNRHDMKPGPCMALTVSDTGMGIPPEDIGKVFDPFFTTKKVGEGTGLGLSVAHGIVKGSGGSISVESTLGKGSTFTVYLPQIAQEAKAEESSQTEIPTGTEHILFVDDEEALLEMGEEVLAELGYEVTSSMSSADALSLLKKDPQRYDLVITDQTMPEMTGIELTLELLAIRPDLPIIMCTGFSHLVDPDRAKAAGIRAFAMKPLTKREIACTIRDVLGR